MYSIGLLRVLLYVPFDRRDAIHGPRRSVGQPVSCSPLAGFVREHPESHQPSYLPFGSMKHR